MMEYRNELKFIVNEYEIEILNSRLKNILSYDKNVSSNNSYNIRSIYFDDYNDRYLHENESGSNNRFKVRIRIYNGSDSMIKLEIKHKLNGMTKKESCNISRGLFISLIKGEQLNYADLKDDKVLRRFFLEYNMSYLRPKVLVEYDRSAFVYAVGNVRITFDRNIRASYRFDRFFDENTYAMPVLESGKHILEVKYDEILPDHISQQLELNNLMQTAFSKYYISRVMRGI